MPPWHRFEEFLDPAAHAALLEWTMANQGRFKPAGTARGLDLDVRVSKKLTDLGPLHAPVENRIREMLPQIFARTGARPFEVEHVELEIVAHGDGAFFSRHTDIPIGPNRLRVGGDGTGTQDRILSAVYYYHNAPKRFSGGALRIYRLNAGDAPDDHVDVEPLQNSLVAFPSWAQHEVLKIACPGDAFENSRFAVNAWLCRTIRS